VGLNPLPLEGLRAIALRMTEEVRVEEDVTLSIHLIEDEDAVTQAIARLDLRGEHFETSGTSRRNPNDSPHPLIGEEIAIARALGELQNQLAEAAWAKIYTREIR